MNGYIKMYKQILNWEWYKDINVKTLFIHCLLKSAYSETKFKGTIVKRGEFISTLEQLAQETGLSISQVRTAISKLKKTGELETTSSNRNTVFYIKNYDKYQAKEENKEEKGDKQITNEKQAEEAQESVENQQTEETKTEEEQENSKQMTSKSHTRKEYIEYTNNNNNNNLSKNNNNNFNNSKRRREEEMNFDENSFEMMCINKIISNCESLYYSTDKKDLEKKQEECAVLSKMQSEDRINRADILTALDYALKDEFWQIHVKSAQKFKKHFDILINKAKAAEKKTQQQAMKKENRFNDIPTRDYDFSALEKALIG